MPRGCYYQKYGVGAKQKRELFIVFDAKNGLRPNKDYQIVVNGRFSATAINQGEYLEIFTMDDIDINPYKAVERGIAKLNRTPVTGATIDNNNEPLWAETNGLEILGGSEYLRILKQADPLLFRLSGLSKTNAIIQGMILRIYL